VRRGDIASATDHFSVLQTTTVNVSLVHRYGCFYYAAAEKTAYAMQECTAAVSDNPDSGSAYVYLGWAAVDAGQYKVALSQFRIAYRERAHSVNEDAVANMLWLGVIAHWLMGFDHEAKQMFKMIESHGSKYITAEGLKTTGLVFTRNQMAKIEAAIAKFHK